MLLVGPPKPDRSKDRGQTRFDPNPSLSNRPSLLEIKLMRTTKVDKVQ